MAPFDCRSISYRYILTKAANLTASGPWEGSTVIHRESMSGSDRRGWRSIVALLCVILWWGCGEAPPEPLNDGDTLARVGDDQVTVADYHGYLGRLPEEARNEVQKERLLQAIVDEKLILAECRRLGLDQSPEFRELVQNQTKRLSLAELYRREGIVRGQPTEAELAQMFAASPYSKRVRFSLLMVKDADKLPPLMAQLQAGADFEELSMEHSQDHRILMRHADMGYHRWGETMPSHEALTQKAFTMEPGQLAGPLAVADGHFLLKVTDVHPVSLEQERETINRAWRQRHLARQLAVYCDTLMARFEVTFEADGLAVLHTILSADDGQAPDRAALRQIVVHLTEGELSVEACLRLLGQSQVAPGALDDLRRLLENRLSREVLMLQEIGRLDLVNSAEVKSGLVEARRKAMLDLIRRRIESEVAPPSLSLVQLHFDANQEDYREVGQVTLRRLTIADREAGERVIAQIESGVDTAAIYGSFVQVTYPIPSGEGELARALRADPGPVRGPFAEENGFVVLQILQQRASRIPDFAEVQEAVTRDLLAQERSEVFDRYVAQLRVDNADTIEIHADRVQRLGDV
ncbi:MAG: hypothetical protein CME04_12960 [Gemmatimonadaceae bacterium]|nr:hypothetical protein [Gemmatimonadaceae bacterium]